jgi:RNase P/RNase MRP subunit POP5
LNDGDNDLEFKEIVETLRKSLSEALGRVQQNNSKLRKGYGKTERGDEDGLPPMRVMSN